MSMARYNDVDLPAGEAAALVALERETGEILPVFDTLGHRQHGFETRGGHVTALAVVMKGLVSIPDEIGKLASLVYLDLNNNDLTSLPDRIGDLASLQELDLQYNQLESLPATIGKLKSLKHLTIAANQVSALPATFCNLVSLAVLPLGGNRLASLPDGMQGLASLTHLDASCNELTSLPSSIVGLRSLVRLDIDGNPLAPLPGTITAWIESLRRGGGAGDATCRCRRDLYMGRARRSTRAPLDALGYASTRRTGGACEWLASARASTCSEPGGSARASFVTAW